MESHNRDRDGTDQQLTVIVNGEEVHIRANPNQQISVIVREALREAEQTGRKPEDWQLRTGESDGSKLLEPDKKLRDYGIGLPTVLFLSLNTGGGGSD